MAAEGVKTSVFGLDVRLAWPVQGCPPRAWSGKPQLDVGRAEAGQIDAEWDTAGAERVVREPGDGRALLTVDVADGAYRVAWRHIGQFLLTAGDGRVLCAPERGGEPHFERYLLAQILPLAAVAAGVEVLHASAVELDGRAVGVVGAGGAGKSATARALVEAGGRLITDDVLAVTRDGAGLIAHLGPDHVRVGPAEAKEAVQLPAARDVVPLDALFFLDRGARRVSVGTPVGFRRLAGSTFNLLVRTPDRLERHLDVAATLARDHIAVVAGFPPDATPDQIAEAMVAWLGDRT